MVHSGYCTISDFFQKFQKSVSIKQFITLKKPQKLSDIFLRIYKNLNLEKTTRGVLRVMLMVANIRNLLINLKYIAICFEMFIRKFL